jgi:hypothetical protein
MRIASARKLWSYKKIVREVAQRLLDRFEVTKVHSHSLSGFDSLAKI